MVIFLSPIVVDDDLDSFDSTEHKPQWANCHASNATR